MIRFLDTNKTFCTIDHKGKGTADHFLKNNFVQIRRCYNTFASLSTKTILPRFFSNQ